MLVHEEFFAWCGERLVVASGGDRFATFGKRLVAATPPSWRAEALSRDRSRSWVSPACAPDRKVVAAAAGPSGYEGRFGQEQRAIWALTLDGAAQRLTRPSHGFTDEYPRWSNEGRSLLFVRSGPNADNSEARGALYLVRLDGSLVGPIVSLGSTVNYYGHYARASQLDWLQR